MDEHVVIIGAGPAGLAAAWVIRRAGLDPLVVTLDRRGLTPYIGAASSPEHPGLWFFGLDGSIYGNMHVHRGQARQLARAITS